MISFIEVLVPDVQANISGKQKNNSDCRTVKGNVPGTIATVHYTIANHTSSQLRILL